MTHRSWHNFSEHERCTDLFFCFSFFLFLDGSVTERLYACHNCWIASSCCECKLHIFQTIYDPVSFLHSPSPYSNPFSKCVIWSCIMFVCFILTTNWGDTHRSRSRLSPSNQLFFCVLLYYTCRKQVLTLWCLAVCQLRRGQREVCLALSAIRYIDQFAWGQGMQTCLGCRDPDPPVAKDLAPRGRWRLICSPRETDLRREGEKKTNQQTGEHRAGPQTGQ